MNRFSFEDTFAATGYSKSDVFEHFFVEDVVRQLVEGRSKDGSISYLEQEKLIHPHSEGGYDVTNLLVLTAARDFTEWAGLERKGIRLIRYKGNTKLEAEEEINGVFGYFVAFERALNSIMSRTPHREEMRHGLRQTTYDFPRVAIREILANAIIHQDFTILGFGPTVEIFGDRIVITNPGKPLVDPDRFIDAPSRTRNNNLADLMRRLGVCEERGSGIDRAFTEIELAGLPPPLIQQVSDCTVVTIFGPRPFAQMTKEERLRACYFHACLRAEKNDFMSNASLRQRFRLSQKQYSQVSEVIKEACAVDLIKPLSEDQGNRNARYLPYWY
ncbi:MAG: transcriptional regulator [Parvularcula sp.]|nr:transcriptional regulator [Parvularcula sp.]